MAYHPSGCFWKTGAWTLTVLLLGAAMHFHFRDDPEAPPNPFAAHLPPKDEEGVRSYAEAAARFHPTLSSAMDDYDTHVSPERLAIAGFPPARKAVEEDARFLVEAEAFLNSGPIRFTWPAQDLQIHGMDSVFALKSSFRVLAAGAALAMIETREEDAIRLWENHSRHESDFTDSYDNFLTALTRIAARGIKNRSLLEIAFHSKNPGIVRRALRLQATHPIRAENLFLHAMAGEYEFVIRGRQSLAQQYRNATGGAALSSPKGLAQASLNFWWGLNTLPNTTLRRMDELYMKANVPLLAKPTIPKPDFLTLYLGKNCGGENLAAQISGSIPMVHNHILGRVPAMEAMTRASLAIRLHEITQGRRPEKLAELSPGTLPDLPTDPYDGAPVRYDAKRGVLWCLGKDFTDNGGDEEDDVVLCLPGCEPPDAESVYDQEKRLLTSSKSP